MAKKILFIVEGKREKEELEKGLLLHCGLAEVDHEIIVYETTIHELYDLLTAEENEGIELSTLLLTKKKISIQPHFQVASTFSAIYLIFDFDSQYHKYDPAHLRFLAKHFDDETDEGLLLLNYPMHESLFDIEDLNDFDRFLALKAKVTPEAAYKHLVKKRTCFKTAHQVYRYIGDPETFKKIAAFNLRKYLHLLRLPACQKHDPLALADLQIHEYEQTKQVYVLNTMCLLYYETVPPMIDASQNKPH